MHAEFEAADDPRPLVLLGDHHHRHVADAVEGQDLAAEAQAVEPLKVEAHESQLEIPFDGQDQGVVRIGDHGDPMVLAEGRR